MRACRLTPCPKCGHNEYIMRSNGNFKECFTCKKVHNKTYKVRNPHLKLAEKAKRRATKLSATPSWLTSEDFWLIREVYSISKLRTTMTGTDWEVDHIVPLQGKNVCGLHVPLNLQVITAHENRTKGNRYKEG